MAAPSVDLLAALRPHQVTVRVGGHPFALQATTAAQWLGAIAMDLTGLCGIMPGLIADEDLDQMQELMAQHPDITQRWLWGARTALGRAGGRDWWWTANLARQCLGTWIYINGALLRQGVNAQEAAFPDWLDACYSMLWQAGDEESRTQLDLRLGMRPQGVAIARTRRQVQQEAAAFAAD